MTILVEPCTIGMMATVTEQIRPEDAMEAAACYPDLPMAQIAATTLATSEPTAWAALVDGAPYMVFGFRRATASVASAWSWGTAKSSRAAPATTRFIAERWPSMFSGVGVRRCEVRTHGEHHKAHSWLQKIGFVKECDCPQFGAKGETFQLWAWTAPWNLGPNR